MMTSYARFARVMAFASAVCLACVMLFAGLAPAPGHAAPANAGKAGEELGIGALSDRYESLNSLGNSLTEEEKVVIETRIGVLTSVNRALDESEVRFTGEVVGDVVNAGEGHKWANVLGASNTVISVYMTDEQAQLIELTGGYHATGTSLKMTGIYHVACPEHQGELDVHATNAEVAKAGKLTKHPVRFKRAHAAFVSCLLAAVVLGSFALVRRYLRKREDD